MPTLSNIAALLILGSTDSAPWTWSAWSTRVGISVAPFMQDATSESFPSLSPHAIPQIQAYSRKLWSHEDQLRFSRAKDDNDHSGRKAWATWVDSVWPKLRVYPVLIDYLSRAGRDPLSIMRKLKMEELPTMKRARVEEMLPAIAGALFGDDAFIDPDDDDPLLKEEVARFLNIVIANLWSNWRRTFSRDSTKIETLESELETLWDDLTADNRSQPVTASDVKKLLVTIKKLTNIYKRWGTESSLQKLAVQKERIEAMQSATRGQRNATIKPLPKALKLALEMLASAEDIEVLNAHMSEQLQQLDPIDAVDEEMPDLDLDHAEAVDWSEGVEEYQNLSTVDLYMKLGLPEKRIPYFNDKYDPSGVHNAWEEGDKSWFIDGGEELRLRWHQLVGVHRMLTRAMTSSPVLLMDGVGLGKTIQVIALFAMLAYYRDTYKMKGSYPVKWAWQDADGQRGQIPEGCFVIVVPPALVDQVCSEARHYLEKGSFDVVPLVGQVKNRQGYWESIDSAAHTSKSMRIVVAAQTAVISDATWVFQPHKKDAAGAPHLHPSHGAKRLPSTIFGLEILAIACDEAHSFRRPNNLYRAVLSLVQTCKIFVAMTATPIQNKHSDLWYIGHAIGLDGFSDASYTEFREWTKEVNAGARKDRKYRKENPEEFAARVRGVVSEHGDATYQSCAEIATLKVIKVIRDRFRGAVIRRSVNSKDNTGQPISGLKPYNEIIWLMALYQQEYDNIERLAAEQADGSLTGVALNADFYLPMRKALTHPLCNLEGNIEQSLPRTLEDYHRNPSRKLDALVGILQYHRTHPGAPGLVYSDELSMFDHSQPAGAGQPSMTRPLAPPIPQTSQPADKIIVYAFFPSSFPLIERVLNLNGLRVSSLHGKLTQAQRTRVLKQFEEDGHCQILLMSGVGSVGLNMAFANVLIIVDVLWTVMNDEQLVGRIWRHPQKKQVHIYRLIGDKSPDVYLNNLSFDKGTMQEAFANTSHSLRRMVQLPNALWDHEEDLDQSSQPSTTSGSPNPEGNKPKPRRVKKKAGSDPAEDIPRLEKRQKTTKARSAKMGAPAAAQTMEDKVPDTLAPGSGPGASHPDGETNDTNSVTPSPADPTPAKVTITVEHETQKRPTPRTTSYDDDLSGMERLRSMQMPALGAVHDFVEPEWEEIREELSIADNVSEYGTMLLKIATVHMATARKENAAEIANAFEVFMEQVKAVVDDAEEPSQTKPSAPPAVLFDDSAWQTAYEDPTEQPPFDGDQRPEATGRAVAARMQNAGRPTQASPAASSSGREEPVTSKARQPPHRRTLMPSGRKLTEDGDFQMSQKPRPTGFASLPSRAKPDAKRNK